MRTHVPGVSGVAHVARAGAEAARICGHVPVFAPFETDVASDAGALASTGSPAARGPDSSGSGASGVCDSFRALPHAIAATSALATGTALTNPLT
jgi:hypothetical protein